MVFDIFRAFRSVPFEKYYSEAYENENSTYRARNREERSALKGERPNLGLYPFCFDSWVVGFASVYELM